MLQLLPALPPEDDLPPPPPERPRLTVMPQWSGWSLGLTPGHALPALPSAPPTVLTPDAIAPPRRFSALCHGCAKRYHDEGEYLFHPCRHLRIEIVVLFDVINLDARSSKKRKRKCSPFPRARTKNIAKISARRRGAPAQEPIPLGRSRLPVYREECKGGYRPCPLVSCRAHNAFSVNEENGSCKENYPHLRIWDDPEGPGLHALEAIYGTCSLDTADEADDGTDGVAGLLALYETATSGRPIGTTAGLTLEETAKLCNLSVERIRQLGARALQEVRVALRRLEGASPGERRR